MSKIDTNLYSRQIGTYGMETMGKLMQMKAGWTGSTFGPLELFPTSSILHSASTVFFCFVMTMPPKTDTVFFFTLLLLFKAVCCAFCSVNC